MTTGYFIGQTDLDKIISEMKQSFHEEVKKLKAEMKQEPMTRAETAKHLKCSMNHVDKHWRNLRHMVHGTPMWFKDEIDAYIRKQ